MDSLSSSAPSPGSGALFLLLPSGASTFFLGLSPVALSVNAPPAHRLPLCLDVLVHNPSLNLLGQARWDVVGLVSPTGRLCLPEKTSPSGAHCGPSMFPILHQCFSPAEKRFNGADLFSVRGLCGPMSDAVEGGLPPPQPSGVSLSGASVPEPRRRAVS